MGHSSAHAPSTAGRVLHSARLYDVGAFVLTLGRENRLRQATVRLAGLQPGQSVLDVGCGTGTLAIAARRAVGASGTVAGIDPSPEMIARARSKTGKAHAEVDFRIGVIEALPFADASFDAVLSSLMLHHLPEPVKRAGFGEVARVLKPGGVFVAVDLATGTHGPIGHLMGLFGRHGSAAGLRSAAGMLRAAGFRDVTGGRMESKVLGYVSGTRA